MVVPSPLPWLHRLQIGIRQGSTPQTNLSPNTTGHDQGGQKKLSLLERYQGAFGGSVRALLEAGLTPSQCPDESLQAIALAYDRSPYRYQLHRREPARLQHWSLPHWLFAELLWQTLDDPNTLGNGVVWVDRILEGWCSLPWDDLGMIPERQFILMTGETVRSMVANRTPLTHWPQWLRQLPHQSALPQSVPAGAPQAATEPLPNLTLQDLWVILGILGRTDGYWAAAIAQTQAFEPAIGIQETRVLSCIGATIGLTVGPVPLPASTPIALRNALIAAHHQGIQCFRQWAGLPLQDPQTSYNSHPLTPWTIGLSSQSPSM